MAAIILAAMGFALGANHVDWQVLLGYILSALVVLFFVWRLFRKLASRRPVFILESHALTINQRKTRTILWSEIIEWEIRIYKSNKYLFIRTSSGKVNVAISWLDRPVKQITELLENYIQEPGPGGVKRDKLPIL